MSRKPRIRLAALLSLLLIPPSMALMSGSAAAGAPAQRAKSCAVLAAVVQLDPEVLSATSAVAPAAGQQPAHCRVRLVQAPAITIEVGLPLNSVDGGTGGSVSGGWNGRVYNLGGGGYGGFVPGLTAALARGGVGSGTDTGHSTAWCNAVNPATGLPNSQPDCGLAGGGFVLDPRNKLLTGQVDDFITDSLYAQTRWALDLTKVYYGRPAVRNYWVGASTGGRQGWQMAQSYGNLFDGFLVGMPAINWNRFIIAEAWPAVVTNELLGAGGLAPAKSTAANATAVAACDGLDGLRDELLADPYRCTFNANRLICTGRSSDAPTCLTATEAKAINMIWDGPRDAKGKRLWGGITRGTSFGMLLPGGTGMGALIETYLRYWMYQDPAFDWRAELTIKNFPETFAYSARKFQESASTDSTDLSKVRAGGAKVIFYHGGGDSLIVPYGSYDYARRLFDRYGVRQTRSFVRTFFFPGVDHTTPVLSGGDGQQVMLDALQAWVEGGTAPESFTQTTGPDRSLTICAYPEPATGSRCTARG